jgi:hypothetical protein
MNKVEEGDQKKGGGRQLDGERDRGEKERGDSERESARARTRAYIHIGSGRATAMQRDSRRVGERERKRPVK